MSSVVHHHQPLRVPSPELGHRRTRRPSLQGEVEAQIRDRKASLWNLLERQ